ncbi:MobC family plasmid mobilization relaxosome protein (plasmid) [Rhodovastum atsumiense]|uniref:MobC family plasmid mobilization relaxosome protein n=1 Tax=Rhodovastum atsumiense TaxID=504468 RepID=A0A5M6INT4_9PROT|nr:plasmid mobilization relaxosome protein MobC [Rhodovastum atsumiense]KAA5609569.1 MobC family plasmid mobilization relaxosome protein [Rhodovastum atsumiense]CAH2606398.1 MobC family plasmid mobilization relaxosome protein [Rhodovastum atsumiense]
MGRYRRTYSGARRTAGYTVQLTPHERMALEQRAESHCLTMAAYVRARCLNGHLPPADRTCTRAEQRELVAALARIGNNLNQLAHHANATGEIASARALRAALAELGEATRRIMGV